MKERLYETVDLAEELVADQIGLGVHQMRLGRREDGSLVLYTHGGYDYCHAYVLKRQDAETLLLQLQEALGKQAPVPTWTFNQRWRSPIVTTITTSDTAQPRLPLDEE